MSTALSARDTWCARGGNEAEPTTSPTQMRVAGPSRAVDRRGSRGAAHSSPNRRDLGASPCPPLSSSSSRSPPFDSVHPTSSHPLHEQPACAQERARRQAHARPPAGRRGLCSVRHRSASRSPPSLCSCWPARSTDHELVDRLQQWKHVTKSLLHYYKASPASSAASLDGRFLRLLRPLCSPLLHLRVGSMLRDAFQRD